MFGEISPKMRGRAWGSPKTKNNSAVVPYVRPVDWLALPTLTDDDNKFVGLHAVYPDSNFCALSASGNYTVDWGDGVVENIASGVQANHEYDYTNPALVGTECSRGYKQAVVTVTPQTGQTFTSLNLYLKHSQPGLSAYSSGFLDIALAGGGLTSLKISNSNTASIRMADLEQVIVYKNAVVDMAYMFYNCYSLQTVPLFNTAAVTIMTAMFYNCYSLQTVPLFNTAAVTNMTAMFQSCTSLQTVPLFNTAAVTIMSNMFQSCTSLQTVPLFNTAAVTNMAYMFQSCTSLQTVPLFNTAAVTNMTAMFYNCYSLQTIPAFVASSVTTGKFGVMFQNCNQLANSAIIDTKFTISYASCKLSKARLEDILRNLGVCNAQTVDISNNYGADAPVSLAGNTVSGSNSIAMANTERLTIGMSVSGVGMSHVINKAVTGDAATDTITLVGHGFSGNAPVLFTTFEKVAGISPTTVVLNSVYYPVAITADTFKLAATVGGTPVDIDATLIGTLRVGAKIDSIIPNTSVTLCAPAVASGTATFSFRNLDTNAALMKNWTILG